jgi:hypothetical protein
MTSASWVVRTLLGWRPIGDDALRSLRVGDDGDGIATGDGGSGSSSGDGETEEALFNGDRRRRFSRDVLRGPSDGDGKQEELLM